MNVPANERTRSLELELEKISGKPVRPLFKIVVTAFTALWVASPLDDAFLPIIDEILMIIFTIYVWMRDRRIKRKTEEVRMRLEEARTTYR